jgi:hypothetical protein
VEISGDYSFGYLKSSTVSPLIRLSPFDADHARPRPSPWWGYAEAEGMDVRILPEDLKIDTFRSSAPATAYAEDQQRRSHYPCTHGHRSHLPERALQLQNKIRHEDSQGALLKLEIAKRKKREPGKGERLVAVGATR